MKHLLTLAALLVSTLSLAQFTPYNPDADNDQFVGAQDLLAFLPLFGEDWDLDSLKVYGVSELVEPEWCPFQPAYDCSYYNFRVVPQDADVVYWDQWDAPEMIESWLVLPELPKPLIVFGVSDNVELQTYPIYLGEPSETSPVYMQFLERASGASWTAVLMGFDGRWWQVH